LCLVPRAVLQRDDRAVTFPLHALHELTGDDLDAVLLEGLLDGVAHLRILERREMREPLDDRHLRAEGVEEERELETNRATAENDDALRLCLADDELAVRHDVLAVGLHAGEPLGARARR